MERDPDSSAGSLQPGSAKAIGDCGCFHGLGGLWLSLKYFLVLALGESFPSSHLLQINGVYHLCLQPLSLVTVIRRTLKIMLTLSLMQDLKIIIYFCC